MKGALKALLVGHGGRKWGEGGWQYIHNVGAHGGRAAAADAEKETWPLAVIYLGNGKNLGVDGVKEG
jgi:hypothetical protein